MSDAIAWRYRLNEPGALWTYTLAKPRPKVFDLYEVQPLFGREAAPEITEAMVERAAKAIAKEIDVRWDSLLESEKEEPRRCARAALEARKEG